MAGGQHRARRLHLIAWPHQVIAAEIVVALAGDEPAGHVLRLVHA
jgi:hypothetical protein